MTQSETEALAPEPVLTSSEVAALFRVDIKTVSRWANQRRLPSFQTPGGHRRFLQGDVRAALKRGRVGPAS
ncbi:helix-turn-helix domain-containing protein [Nocardiopsis aegyptia]|uniref:helix-turn-helix domain-containing protein n=1 Tax=Nocardiopsis aegyptia TaxID=220378 RepID=UPI00366F78AA